MQRTEPEGIVISCDFCGTDWDEIKPMIEGHHGSILCLECMQTALSQIEPGDSSFSCTLCLVEKGPEVPRWSFPERSSELLPGVNPGAVLCQDCLNQAAGTFSKDPDVDWKKPR